MLKKKTILVVVAHADDMEFMAAGTVARFVSELGYDVYEYILTDNGKGSYRLPHDELVRVSAAEAVAAGALLGVKEVRFAGYPDGGLNEVNPNALRDEIIAFIRETRADLVMSWDPFAPLEEHPDHRAVAMATLEAAAFSGNHCFCTACPFEAYPVTEAYWFAKTPWNADVLVDVSKTMDVKVAALLAHDCQMRLTVDSLAQQARALEVEVPVLEGLDEGGYRGLIEMGIRMFAAEKGRASGFEYAEQFRYQSFCGLDEFFGMNVVKRDF